MPSRTALDSNMTEDRFPPFSIGVLGCTGRVGRLIIQSLQSGDWDGRISLAGGLLRAIPQNPPPFFVTDQAEELFERADLLIDFTAPDSTAQYAWLAAKHNKPLVSGTTGLDDTQKKSLLDAANEAPILHAANMSIGVNLLLALVEQTASRLGPEWDIEIAETHHRFKVDAPSGTALALAAAATRGRRSSGDTTQFGDDMQSDIFASPIDRTNPRPPGAIGFAVRRGGDVVGEHNVGFFGNGERLELTHIATNRAIYAQGAIRAAIWLRGQPNGLYGMRDMLGM